MKVLRIFLSIVFMGLIVFGIGKYYKEHPEVHVKHLKKDILVKQTKQKVKQVEQKVKQKVKQVEQKVKQEEVEIGEKNIQPILLHPDFSTGTFSAEIIEQLLSEGIRGGGEGDIIRVHYCDYDLEYCKKSYDSGMVYVYGSMIPEMKYIYKPFPVTKNKVERLAYEAVLCATKYGTQKQALSYYNSLYADKDIRKSKKSLIDFAKQLGIDGIEQCLNQEEYSAVLEKEKQFAKEVFGIHVLPTNFLINTMTGKWVLIPGYYTKEELRGAAEYIKKA